MDSGTLAELEARHAAAADDDEDEDETSSSSSSDDEDEGEEDAEELNRRLEEQLWREISAAKALEAAAEPSVVQEHPPPIPPSSPPLPQQPEQDVAAPVPSSLAEAHSSPSESVVILQRKQEAVLFTIRAIISLLERDPAAQSTLASTILSPPGSGSILDALKQVLADRSVSKERASSLTQSLIGLAQSDALFGKLRQSNTSSNQLDLGKRKRADFDEPNSQHVRTKRRAPATTIDLYPTISDAVRTVTEALQNSPSRGFDPGLIASIQLPLHQIFLFAVTSSSRGGPENNHLQEISGLIQVLGVLSGIPIGQMPPTEPDKQGRQDNFSAWTNPDIGTAVYPCTVAGCTKTFARLFSLRTHQRVHSSQRPYTCNLCPASFVRNHDLKRHSRLHEKKAWKCSGCNKIFSRRDAIKRHRNAAESRGLKGEACVRAEPIQVEVELSDEEDVEKRGEKLVRMWSDHTGPIAAGELEEGEVPVEVLNSTQSAVLHLHYLLQTYVANASGNRYAPVQPVPVDPTAGQATLASVIARAQSQGNTPPNGTTPTPEESLAAPAAPPDAEGSADPQPANDRSAIPSLSLYGLSEEQAKMLQDAITNAALAAQAQAEAEAALEEEDSDDSSDDSSEDEKEADESMAPAQ
ncbi:hypothetical protein VNI00_008564 [Paramarasmius palmivorus]|uniref:C2H2-type domain-containing protein n=1 Tax=Paramarasmius palmivorus TaxID=297713 RepID=A0AAW0CVR4_9AGAR